MPWSDGGARRDANLLRIESFGMRTIARVAFLPTPGVGPQSFANPAIGPERRTVDFPDHTDGRMLEMGTSGLMSGEGKPPAASRPRSSALPRLYDHLAKRLINSADRRADCWQCERDAGCLLRTTWACDRESQTDFIARKTCGIGGEPMLTARGERESFGGPNERKSSSVNASEPQLRVRPRRQNPARSVASMGSDAGCSGSSSGWACNNRDAWPPAPAGTRHRSIGHRRH